MGTFTSKVTGGNWSASGQTTWNEPGVPGDGDTVTLNGPVVADVNLTVGTGGASFTNAIVLAGTAASKLTIAAGKELIARGGIVVDNVQNAATADKLVVNAGAKVSLLAPAGTTYTVQVATDNYQRSRVKIAGVAGVRGEIRLHPSSGAGAAWYFDTAGALHAGFFNLSYGRITNCGTPDQPLVNISHYERGGIGPEQVLDHVEFNGCGSWYQDWAGWGANSVLSWTGVTFKNSVGGVCLDGAGTNVVTQQTYTSCVFDQTINAIWARWSVWTNCQFRDGFGIQASSPAASFTGCIFWSMTSDQNYALLGGGTTMTNCIFVNTWAGSNDPHGTSVAFDSQFAGTTITVDGCSFEMYTAVFGSGNAILMPGGDVTDVFDVVVRNSFLLRNPLDGYSYGDFIHHYTTGATGGPRVTLEHNTGHAAGDAGTIADVVYPGSGARFKWNRSNIWHDSVARGSKVFNNSNFQTGMNADVMLSGGAANNYNGCFNLSADRYSSASIFTFSVAPGANDVLVDPQFVDPSRNLAKWYRSLAATTGSDRTDAEAALNAMRAVNDDAGYNPAFTVAAYRTYLRAGFNPQALAYRTGAHDGTTIGAVPYSSVATGPTYTLTAGTGTVAVSGANAKLARQLSLKGNVGTVNVAGVLALLLVARRLTAGTGTVVANGVTARLLAARRLVAAVGTVTTSGSTAALKLARRLVAAVGAVTVTGSPARLLLAYRLAAAAGTFVAAGGSAFLTIGNALALLAAAGSFAVSGSVARLIIARRLVAASGAATVTTAPGALNVTRRIMASVGAVVVTGSAATLTYARRLVAAAGALTVAGSTAVFGISSALQLLANSAAYAVTGGVARLLIARRIAGSADSATVTTAPARLSIARRLVAGSASLSVTGASATLARVAAAIARAVRGRTRVLRTPRGRNSVDLT